ncbi:MAG: hypothetical protein SPD11_00275 [Sphaerochaetaceae bacterium]|nr:hypothetical protein [Sphaerochaetaceae bacterium]
MDEAVVRAPHGHEETAETHERTLPGILANLTFIVKENRQKSTIFATVCNNFIHYTKKQGSTFSSIPYVSIVLLTAIHHINKNEYRKTQSKKFGKPN